MSALKSELLEQKAQLISYLTSKIKANDFHAVQDAASDIREIDAKLSVLAEMAAQPVNTAPIGHAHQFRYVAPRDLYVCGFCGEEQSVAAFHSGDPAEIRRIG